MLDSFEIILNDIPFVNSFRYLLQLLVSNCKFLINTMSPLFPKYLHGNIVILISTHNRTTLTLHHLKSAPSSLYEASLLI